MNKFISFCINDYPGNGNDLRGCLNDQKNFVNKLQQEGFNFEYVLYRNEQCRKSNVINQLTKTFEEAKMGDVIVIQHSHHGSQIPDNHGDEQDGYDEVFCMYDHIITDDEYSEMLLKLKDGVMCIIFADCCYSGTNTRNVGSHRKNRFISLSDIVYTDRKQIMLKYSSKWISIATSGENQPSADALINGEWQGAGTAFFLKHLKRGITYNEWIEKVVKELPNKAYPQTPSISGPENLLAMKVFEPMSTMTKLGKNIIKTANKGWRGIDGKKTITGIIFGVIIAAIYYVNAKWPNTIPEWIVDVIKTIAGTFFGVGITHKVLKYYERKKREFNKTEQEFNSLIKIKYTFSLKFNEIQKYFHKLIRNLRK